MISDSSSVLPHQATLLDRFLRYVQIDTGSCAQSDETPSTRSQFTLLHLIKNELTEIGCTDVLLTEYGYLYATIPPSVGNEACPVVALVTHVDTAAEVPTGPVSPQLIVVTPEVAESGLSLGVSRICPGELRDIIGETLITSSGDTLLGADDKNGVAAVVHLAALILSRASACLSYSCAVAEKLEKSVHAPRTWPRIRLVFTPDEELARGLRHFCRQDMDGAHPVAHAFTIDGSWRGVYNEETFDAWRVSVTFHGHNKRAGTAAEEPLMRSAVLAAADFATAVEQKLPRPEMSAGRTGFVHIQGMPRCTVQEACISIITRSFDPCESEQYGSEIRAIASGVAQRRGLECTVESEHQYSNIGEVTNRFPQLREAAKRAYDAVGAGWEVEPFRGGTHGTEFASMGIPTPNLFLGARNFHSTTEFTTVECLYQLASMLGYLVEELAAFC